MKGNFIKKIIAIILSAVISGSSLSIAYAENVTIEILDSDLIETEIVNISYDESQLYYDIVLSKNVFTESEAEIFCELYSDYDEGHAILSDFIDFIYADRSHLINNVSIEGINDELLNSIIMKYTSEYIYSKAKTLLLDGKTVNEIKTIISDEAWNELNEASSVNTIDVSLSDDQLSSTVIVESSYTGAELMSEILYSSSSAEEETEEEEIAPPFYIGNDTGEQISWEDGSLGYVYNIATIPGRGSSSLNLAIKYNCKEGTFLDSTREYRMIVDGLPDGQIMYVSEYYRDGNPEFSDYQIALGWKYDLPHLEYPEGLNIYIPGDGTYRISQSDNMTTDYSENINGSDNVKIVSLVDGRQFYFDEEKYYIVRERDRYGNEINYFYDESDRLIKITDSLGQDTNIVYSEEIDDVYYATITEPSNNTTTICFKNYSLIRDDETPIEYCLLENVSTLNSENQAVTTSFSYYEAPAGFDDRSQRFNPRVILNKVIYPTCAESHYIYDTEDENKTKTRITQRFDKIGDSVYNIINYDYDSSFTMYGDCVTTRYTKGNLNGSPKRTIIKYTAGIDNISADTIYSKHETVYKAKFWKPIREKIMYYDSEGEEISCTATYQYDKYGNMLSKTSFKGSSEAYTTEYTYDRSTPECDDNYYGVPLTQKYRADNDTVIIIQNTLTEDGKGIASTKYIHADTDLSNEVVWKEISYSYDQYGNVLSSDEGLGSNKIKKVYSYEDNIEGRNLSGAFPTSVTLKNAIGGSSIHDATQIFKYDITGNVTESTDALGNVTRFSYDNMNRIVSTTYSNGAISTVARDDINNDTVQKDVNGVLIYNDFNALGYLTKVYRAHEDTPDDKILITENTYGTDGHIVSSKSFTDENKYYIINYSYDSLDRLIEKLTIDSGNVIQNKTAYEYLSGYLNIDNQEVFCFIDTVTIFNKNNDVVSKSRTYTNIYGEKIMECSVIGETETGKMFYTYDKDSAVTSQYILKDDGSKNILASYTYDYADRIISETNNEGNSKTYVYDCFDRITKSSDYNGMYTYYTYNNLGLVTRKQIPVDANLYCYNTLSYDKNGNVLSDKTSSYSGEIGKTESFTYDCMGNVIQASNKIDDYSTVYTHYEYTPSGKISAMYTGLCAPYTEDTPESEYSKYTYTYDNYGNLISDTDSLGISAYKSYNEYGLMVSSTDRNGTIKRYSYDDLGTLVSENYYTDNSETSVKTNSYAHDGINLTSVTSDGITTASTYDSLGRLSSETDIDSDISTVKTYTYDGYGNKLTQNITRGNEVVSNNSYTYDDNFRLTNVFENGTMVMTYGYDANGNLVSEQSPEALTITTYTSGNLVKEKKTTVDGRDVSHLSYSYYHNGNIKSETDILTGLQKQYTYDYSGQLTKETYTNTITNSIVYITAYKYDPRGNRVVKITQDSDGNADATFSVYDKTNKLLYESNGEEVTTVYTYDANGNTITAGNKTYTYDLDNRQITFTDEDATASYSYYPSGLRRSKTVNNETTGFVWDGALMVLEETCDTSNKYTYGLRPIKRNNQFYVFNSHGDVIRTVENGEVIKEYTYDAYGNELNIDESDDNPLRYCGEYFDTENGSIYLRARYYSPVNGRFSTIDPIRDGLNWYAYCRNNPIMFVDPNGTYYIRCLNNGKYKLEEETVWTTLSYTFLAPITHLYFRDIKNVVAGTSYVSDESMFYDAVLGMFLSELGGYASKTGDKVLKNTTDVISNYGTVKSFFERMDIVYSEKVNFEIFNFCGYSQEATSIEKLDDIMILTTYFANINNRYFIDKCYNNMTMFELHCKIENSNNPSILIDKYVSGYEAVLLQRKRDGIPTGGMIRDPNVEGAKFREALSFYSETLSQVKEAFKIIKSIIE